LQFHRDPYLLSCDFRGLENVNLPVPFLSQSVAGATKKARAHDNAAHVGMNCSSFAAFRIISRANGRNVNRAGVEEQERATDCAQAIERGTRTPRRKFREPDRVYRGTCGLIEANHSS
jgi:hypothetical protein